MPQLMAVCVLSGIICGAAMLWGSTWLVYFSYSRGLNPDNIAAPFVTTVGDMITLPAVLGSAFVVHFCVERFASGDVVLWASLSLALIWAVYVIMKARTMVHPNLFDSLVLERVPVCRMTRCGAVFLLADISDDRYWQCV